MNLKKVAFIGTIFIFAISFITHSMYDWFPSTLTFMFFPINESIWEHQKMIYTSYLIWGVVEYFILKKRGLYSKNITFSTVVSAIFNIVLFLTIYMPIYATFGHNLAVTLIVYFVTIMISQYLNYLLLEMDQYYRKCNMIAFILIPLLWLLFIILSYRPILYAPLFFDYESRVYGVKKE